MNDKPFTETGFRSYLAEHRLMGVRCQSCGSLYALPRPLCPQCFAADMAWVELSGLGQLVAYTAVYIAPTAMIAAGYGRENPYMAGIVQLAEGPRISAQIMGTNAQKPGEIAIGTNLQVKYIERGEGDQRRTYLAFEPVAAAPQ
jgi:uncharacterized OB-fold protein